MQIELNIGLDVAGQENTARSRAKRVAMAELMLSRYRPKSQRFITTYQGPNGEVTEHSLFVRLETNNLSVPIPIVYRVAVQLEQDCVAVFFPVTGRGILIGPRHGLWGDFDISHFKRLDVEPARIAA